MSAKRNTTSTLRFWPAATDAFERMNNPATCQHCGREDLLRTVKMTDGVAVMWMGRGCAAKAMGVGLKEYTKAAKVVQDAWDKVERAKQEAAHREADNAWQAFLDGAAGPGERFHQIERLGGYAAANAMYKAAQ